MVIGRLHQCYGDASPFEAVEKQQFGLLPWLKLSGFEGRVTRIVCRNKWQQNSTFDADAHDLKR
jgi:hypothetical protein